MHIPISFDCKESYHSNCVIIICHMQLHKFEEEVGEIVDQASKEEKMETALVRLGETWAKMEFQFVQFGNSDVYTVKMAEEDFEALEDDQVLLQGMIANR